MSYIPKTAPFKHQADELNTHGQDKARGIFWEMGTGKTKLAIDEFGTLLMAGKVDAMVVIAPNGVHRNWKSDEFPAHWPDGLSKETRVHVWDTKKANTKKHSRAAREAFEAPVSVLCISYDAVLTNKGFGALKKWLNERKCFYVLDESARIKTPGAKRTKRILATASRADYRRVLSGTPVKNKPFDVYSQLKFLDPDIWKGIGCSTFLAFKTYFGIWQQCKTQDGKSFENCIAYRNLHTLSDKVSEIGTRITKEEALPHLPPKLYSKRYIDISPEQKKHYAALRDQYYTELSTGDEIQAPLTITKLLRFSQILCGFLTDGDDICEVFSGPNPRMDALMADVEDLSDKAIIWAPFHKAIDMIVEELENRGKKCTWVDGRRTGEARDNALDSFKYDDEIQFLVASPAAIGEGHTLVQAKWEFYYINNYNLDQRLQSEDRAHRQGQTVPVNIVDYCCPGYQDEKVVRSLREKKEVSNIIMKDGPLDWI